MLVPPFVHFAYFIMAIPAWIVAIAGNRKKIYTVLYIISFFSLLLTPQMTIPLLKTTQLGQNKVQSYRRKSNPTTEGRLNALSGSRFYNRYFKSGIAYWLIVLIAFTFIVFGTYFRSFNALESSLFSTGLLMKAFSNTLWYISAIHHRTNVIASLFILGAVLLFLQRYYFSKKSLPFTKVQQVLLWIAMILLFPAIFIFRAAQFTNYASAFLVIFPFIPWINGNFNFALSKVLPIREIIGYFIS